MLDEHWALVAADLISEYRLNVYDRAQMRATSWPAFRVMIGGLFSAETRISRWYEQEHGSAGKAPAPRGGGR